MEINFWRDRNLLRQVATAKKIMNNKYEQTDILNMLKVQPKKNPKKPLPSGKITINKNVGGGEGIFSQLDQWI